MDKRSRLDAVSAGKGKVSLETMPGQSQGLSEWLSELERMVKLRDSEASATQQPKLSDIAAALEQNERQAASLEKILSVLEERLAPVLRGENPDQAGTCVAHDIASPLGETLIRNAARIGGAVNRISEILDRLAL